MTPYLKAMVLVAVAVLPFTPRALAHHAMGGELPDTAWHGLLSGLGHPIIGIDHFAFIAGVGLMSHLVERIVLLPLLFVAGTVLGCFMHVQGYSLPWSELAIAFTVAIAAAMVAMHAKMPISLLASLFVVAGAFHGYAYGESITGAETAPLAAYIIGFGVIQFCLAAGTGIALGTIVRRAYVSETVAMRVAGGGIALVAALALVSIALVA